MDSIESVAGVGAPQSGPDKAAFTPGHTGVNAPDIKTSITEVDPAEYVETLESPRRVEHGRLLLDLFGRVTGEQPVMWGPTMIGYGQMHYRYATGREGDTFCVGFSPRKAKISLYGLPHDQAKLARLGKHAVGASCIYINKPEDVDLAVLEELIREGWENPGDTC